MQPGTINETVTVTGASPTVQTESSDISTLINQTQFSGVGTTLGTPTFGTVTSAGEPRLIEMALKLTF